MPVDGSETSKQGLKEAISIATQLESHIRLLHVVSAFVLDHGYAPPAFATDLIASIREHGMGVLAESQQAVARQHIAHDGQSPLAAWRSVWHTQ